MAGVVAARRVGRCRHGRGGVRHGTGASDVVGVRPVHGVEYIAADLIVGIESGAEAEKLARAPGVADVVHLGVLGRVFYISDGRLTPFPTEVTFGVSDGRYFTDVERPRFAEGRRWEHGAAEAVVNPAFVARTGLDVGDRLQVVAISDEVFERFHRPEDLQAAFDADRSIGRTMGERRDGACSTPTLCLLSRADWTQGAASTVPSARPELGSPARGAVRALGAHATNSW